MPAPGATPDENPNLQAIDLGRGDDGKWRVATRYSDGSYVVSDGDPPNEGLAHIAPGAGVKAPVELGGGQAGVVQPDGSLTTFAIKNPPPAYSGQPAAGAAGAGTGTGRQQPAAATPRYPDLFGGQTLR